MNKILVKCICLFSAAFICLSGSIAQDTMRQSTVEVAPPLFKGNQGFRTWSIGVHAGAMAPFSAFGGRNDFSKWQPALGYGFYIKDQISHTFGIQADFMRGTLKANNDKLWVGLPPPGPYASFQTDLHWTAALSTVITLGNINWSQLHTSIQPYVSIGGGVMSFNPHLITKTGVAVDYKPSGSVYDFYVPFGMGIKANLSPRVNLDLGCTIAFVDGDDMDGYFKDPILSDKFSYLHLGLEFSLGKASKPQLARHNAPAQLLNEMNYADNAMRASLAASEDRYNRRLAELNALKDDMARMKMDSDGDGVSDYFDKCPNTPFGVKVDGAGCALPLPAPATVDTIVKIQQNTTYIVTKEDKELANDTFRNLEFDFAKSTIRTHSFVFLNRLADLMIKKGISLKISGHTDNVGSDEANMELSKDRAQSVKNYLVSQGVKEARIEATWFGERQPIATNKTAAGRQKNRRVEHTIY